MSERDDELNELLKPLAEIRPSAQQIGHWQDLISFKRRSSRSWRAQIIQLAAAACIGFIVGAFVFKKQQSNQMVANNFDATATIESVYLKGN